MTVASEQQRGVGLADHTCELLAVLFGACDRIADQPDPAGKSGKSFFRGELFYDSRFDKIAKNAFTVGSVFPITKRTEFELYYQDQRDSSTEPNYHTRGAGLALSLYF